MIPYLFPAQGESCLFSAAFQGPFLSLLLRFAVSQDAEAFSPQPLSGYLWQGYDQVGKLQ
jgi:hypothetical protein